MKEDLERWFEEIESLPGILEQATCIKTISASLKYFDEEECGGRLFEEGEWLQEQLRFKLSEN